jgi:phosphinothricin acetyltransferase
MIELGFSVAEAIKKGAFKMEDEAEVMLRVAKLADAADILSIYAPYVKKTAITFEYEVPGLSAFRARMQRTLQGYPYLVAERDGRIIGYAYTGALAEREAYKWSVETTIYLSETERHHGLGRRLYQALEDASRLQHVLNLNACIGYPEKEDEYLTKNSALFHAHLGFQMVGKFHQCGYKFGRWYHMIWMEKSLGEHRPAPLPLIPFPAVDRQSLAKLGISG